MATVSKVCVCGLGLQTRLNAGTCLWRTVPMQLLRWTNFKLTFIFNHLAANEKTDITKQTIYTKIYDQYVLSEVAQIKTQEKNARSVHGNWTAEHCMTLMPISSPAKSQTLLSHWLTTDTSSTSASGSVQKQHQNRSQVTRVISVSTQITNHHFSSSIILFHIHFKLVHVNHHYFTFVFQLCYEIRSQLW